MFVTTKIVWDINGTVLERIGYTYDGPLDKLCGASQEQKDIEHSQAAYYEVLKDQAQQEFQYGQNVFKDIFNAMSPILAAGPDQFGFSKAETTDLNTTAITGSSQAYRNAAEAVRQVQAARGGNNFIPSGATMQTDATIAASAAANEANELNRIQERGYEVGRQNYFTAAADLAGATGVFNPSTGAANAANAGGSAAATTANEITQANNSWVQAVTGALGGVAGDIATGGMSNLGKGVGFFGQNA